MKNVHLERGVFRLPSPLAPGVDLLIAVDRAGRTRGLFPVLNSDSLILTRYAAESFLDQIDPPLPLELMR
jgi:hypothetical protein